MPDNRKIMDDERAQELIDEVKARLATKVDKSDMPYKPGGTIAFENLPALTEANAGYTYNISNAFTTTEDFVDGAGINCAAGTDVSIIMIPPEAPGTDPTYKYNLFGGSSVMESITQEELAEMWKDAGILTLSTNTATVAVGADETVTVTQATGTVTVESADTAVATATISDTTVTITGVAAGTTDVTVTSASSATNKKATATIAVTVTA